MGTNERKKKQFKKQLIILGLALLLLYVVFAALSQAIQSDKLACGRFVNSDISKKQSSPRICMEIAKTAGQKSKGLKFRKEGELSEDQGMLFIYPEESDNSFWMKDTYIALDMIFLNSNYEIVGIVHSAEPLTTTQRKVDARSQYVVEVLSGKSKQWGLDKGWKLVLDK